METLFFTGVILSTSINHLVWNMPISDKQLEDEKYWENKVKFWEMERKVACATFSGAKRCN